MTIHFADIEAELDSATAQDGPFQKCLACWHPDSCLEIGACPVYYCGVPAAWKNVHGRRCPADITRNQERAVPFT